MGYVSKYTDLNEPFSNLKKKNVEFIWSEKQQKAFDRLKVITAKKPVVKVFNPKKDITLTTNCKRTFNIWKDIRRSIGYCVDNHLSPAIFNWKKNSFEKTHRLLEFIFNPRKNYPES